MNLIVYAALTDTGICDKNDDRVMVNGHILEYGSIIGEAESEIIATVCDGVGGYAHGDEAATIASEVFATLVACELSQARITEAIIEANARVMAEQRTDPGHMRMSSTVAGLYINGSNFIVFNVGDSKVYRFRGRYLSQLSVDHTYFHEALSYGLISEPSETDSQDGHIITRWIGDVDRCEPSVTVGENRIFNRDIFLLCSDGLSDVLSLDELEGILSGSETLSEKCHMLFRSAKKNGSPDNISIILLEVQ